MTKLNDNTNQEQPQVLTDVERVQAEELLKDMLGGLYNVPILKVLQMIQSQPELAAGVGMILLSQVTAHPNFNPTSTTINDLLNLVTGGPERLHSVLLLAEKHQKEHQIVSGKFVT